MIANPEVPAPARRRRLATFSAAPVGWVALGLGAILVPLALVLPVVTVSSTHGGLQPRWSLVHYYGPQILLVVAIPLVIAVAVLMLLVPGEHYAARRVIAIVFGAAVSAAALFGTVTVLVPFLALPSAVCSLLAGCFPQNTA